jgi:imidazolonepropionase-like amidohydrolase
LLPGKVRAKLPVDGNIFTGRIMIRKITRFGSLLPLLCLSQLAMAQGGSYALTNANLFNGVDNRIQENATVLVNDGKIERIAGSNASIPSTYEVIDCEGHFLMPGLFDVHTHINSLAQARRALESGVTTIRTASVPAFQDVSLRELAKAGKIPGPDVAAAGVFVTPNLGETVLADPRLKELAAGVNTDEELRLLVNINADRGVDVIKTRGTQRAGLPDTDPRQQVYTERQLRVIVEEAARHDIPVMVHAHGDEGARAAVLAGARSIEHGTYLSDETIRLMKERGTWFVPTYVTMDEMNEEQYDYVLRLRGKHMVPQLERAVREAHRQGVKIATGADNYYDSKSINRISIEAEQFVRMGMSNFEALQSATVVSAELLQIEDQTGRIEEGFEADMILVPANPLQDIAALQDVLLVMSNGQVAVKRIPFAKTDL